jgi:hypothetical protein
MGGGFGNGGQGVSLSDFQNARPNPFATAPEPMDAEDWLTDTERKLKTIVVMMKRRFVMQPICLPDQQHLGGKEL